MSHNVEENIDIFTNKEHTILSSVRSVVPEKRGVSHWFRFPTVRLQVAD